MILLQIIFINHLLYSLYIYIHIYVEIFSYCNKKNLVGSCRYHVFYCGHHHHRIANLIKDLYDEDDIVQQKKKLFKFIILHALCCSPHVQFIIIISFNNHTFIQLVFIK